MPPAEDPGFDLSTTVGLTRCLRNKKTSVQEIHDISISLIEGEDNDDSHSKYHLPQKERFIFELLCDRLSQQNLVEFKTSPLVWDLFYKTWLKFDEEKGLIHVRETTLQKTKLSNILAASFDEIDHSSSYNDHDLVRLICDCVLLITKQSRLIFSQDQSVSMISHLLNFVCSATPPYGNDLVEIIASIIVSIFRQSNTSALQYNKKNVSLFCGSCLPNLVLLISSNSTTSGLQQSLGKIVEDVLFSGDNLASCKDNLGFFVNSARAQSKIGTKELAYLFKTVIPHFDVPDIEEIFKYFTTRYPESTAELLKEVVKINKTLSTKFLSGLVEPVSFRPGKDSYEIMIQSLKRNTEVGLKFGKRIFNRLIRQPEGSEDLSLQLLEILFQCYSKSREISAFVSLWQENILKDKGQKSVLVSDEFILFCSSYFVALPYVQLERLVRKLVDSFRDQSEKAIIPLTSICIGLLTGVTGSVHSSSNSSLISAIEKLKDLFIEFLSIAARRSYDDHVWKLTSYVFMLYDLKDLDPSIKTIFGDVKDGEGYYFAIFRILEQDSSYYRKEIGSTFVEMFAKSESIEFKRIVFKRWCVLLNAVLDSGEIGKLVEVLFAQQDSTLVREILSNPVLHEQRKFMGCIVDSIICQCNDKVESSLLFADIIPVYSYTKQQRRQMIDALYGMSISLDSDRSATRRAIVKLLELPTYKSILETDSNSLFRLVSTSETEESLALSLEIAETICFECLRQSEDESGYIKTLAASLSEKMAEDDVHTHVSIVLSLVGSWLKLHPDTDRFSDLLTLSATKCLKLLSGDQSDSEICWLSNALANLYLLGPDCIDKSGLKQLVKRIGSEKGGSPEVQSALFKIVCTFSDSYEPYYIISLFLTLANTESNFSSVDSYIDKLDETQFIEIWKQVLEGFASISDEDVDSYLWLVCSFFERAKRPVNDDSEAFQSFQGLVLQSLSSLISLKESLFLSHFNLSVKLLVCVKTLVSAKYWSLAQYSIELIFVLVEKITHGIMISENSEDGEVQLYIQLTQVVASIVLFQRFRLSNRFHLLVAVTVHLMEALFEREGFGPTISSSKDCGIAFERLMGNICEPSTSSITGHSSKVDDGSTDVSATTLLSREKVNLRRSLPIVLLNYLRFFLRYKVRPEMKDYLSNSIYLVFNTLTSNELNYVNASVDSQSRAAFKKLYDDYVKFGKWKED
ncbi:DEKNAAC102202 [Brettanomyces naardenensis]|uniref:DEKNAAC102202 n=1 Tax=Brettanomyces naardenensis TaxID=13370 RepID=A0A448YK33_BRENA|nr:DEKNAAC102202 [Brettanomyces naardenensis]